VKVISDCSKCGNSSVQFSQYFSKKYKKYIRQSRCDSCRSRLSSEESRKYRATDNGKAVSEKCNNRWKRKSRAQVDESYARALLMNKGRFTHSELLSMPELVRLKQAQILLARELDKHV